MDWDDRMGQTPEQALEDMVTRYADQLYRLCSLYLRNTQDAQDAVQETFLKAYRSWRGFRHESSELTWLTRIALRTCHDLRRGSRLKMLDRSVLAEEAAVQPDDKEMQGDVTQAVLALSEKYRVPLLLHYYQGLPVRDVAAVLHLPLGTVLTRLRRGRELLRGILTEGGDLR